jgi:hypothetical protein
LWKHLCLLPPHLLPQLAILSSQLQKIKKKLKKEVRRRRDGVVVLVRQNHTGRQRVPSNLNQSIMLESIAYIQSFDPKSFICHADKRVPARNHFFSREKESFVTMGMPLNAIGAGM